MSVFELSFIHGHYHQSINEERSNKQHQACLAETLTVLFKLHRKLLLMPPWSADIGSKITDDDVVSDHPRQQLKPLCKPTSCSSSCTSR